MSRHKCNNTVGRGEQQWAHCAVCGGRIHEPECTTKKKKGIDCPGQEYHTPQEMEAAGYGPASTFPTAKKISNSLDKTLHRVSQSFWRGVGGGE